MTATKGLEGIVATTSSVSSIIDDTLTYAGYNIDDLAENASFEEVVYLLWHRKLPNAEQLNEIKNNLRKMQKFHSKLLNTSNHTLSIKFTQWLLYVLLYLYLACLMKKQM